MAKVIIKKLKQPIVVHIYFDKKAKIWYNYITLRIFKLKTEYNNAQSRGKKKVKLYEHINRRPKYSKSG